MEKQPIIKNKKQLCEYYNISYETLNNWLKKIPNLKLERGQRILPPKQLDLILEHLG